MVFLHKMKFFVFTVVVLITIQGAYAIKCYKCHLDVLKFFTAASKGNFSGMNLCSNPNDTFDCSQDPDIGDFADVCYTTNVTMNISRRNIGEVKFYTQDCAISSYCSDLKKKVCDLWKTTFARVPDFGISHCDVSCCKGDLCNNPSEPPATTPLNSSVISTNIPPNAAVFGILGLVTVAFNEHVLK